MGVSRIAASPAQALQLPPQNQPNAHDPDDPHKADDRPARYFLRDARLRSEGVDAMLQSNQIEELMTLVSGLDRDSLVHHLRTYRANFPIDFTTDYLGRLPLDKVPHIFVA